MHVDDREGAWDLHYALPASLESEVVEKGSVALDGVSLTINRVWDGHFSVTVVPHTRDHTQLLDGGLGRAVNIETDLLAKYVRRSLSRMEAGGGEPTG